MTSFTAKSSLLRLTLLASGALLFVSGGLWMAGLVGEVPTSRRHPEMMDLLIGYFSILFFGGVFLVIVKLAFGHRELLALDGEGLRARQWSNDIIPWCEITGISTWTHRGSTSIVLHLRDPSLYPGRGLIGWLASANRRLTGGDIAVAMTASDKSVGETLDAIDFFRSNYSLQVSD